MKFGAIWRNMECTMMKFKMNAAAAAFVMTAFTSVTAAAQSTDNDMSAPSTEGVVTSEQSCTYEGGDVIQSQSGTVCFVALRGEEYSTKLYDNQRLGVIKCSGNGAFANELVQPSGNYCRVYLEQKKVPPTRAEIEASTRAAMEAETRALEVEDADTN